MRPNWQGVFPAVTTQFHPDQSLDLEATARHIEVLIEVGRVRADHARHGRRELLARAGREARGAARRRSEHARGRVPVLTGVAECTTAAGLPVRARTWSGSASTA